MTDLQKEREYFSGDRYATENGAVIEEISETYAVCSLSLEQRHTNVPGNVMGGAVFMLADFAFAAASNFVKKPRYPQPAPLPF